MFGVDIFDASILVSALVAMLAGLISFLSPCVLPIVPPYLAYMAGTSTADMTGDGAKNRGVVRTALFFVLGLSTVFIILGLAASAFGRAVLQYQDWFNAAAGYLISLFGLHFLGVIRIPLLYKEARIDAGNQSNSPLGAYVFGLAFAFGWTPCIGPILGAILSMAAQDASMVRGMALMAFYAIGLGVPFVLAAVFIDRFMGVMNKLKRYMGVIEKVMGVLLLIVAVLLWTGGFAALSFWLLEVFPALALLG